MRPRELNTLVTALFTDIIYGLQVDRSGIGEEYIASGYPDDYRIYVQRHASESLNDQELSRVASLVKAEVDSYLDGILHVEGQLFRQAQDAGQIVQLIMQYAPNADSVDELKGNIEGVLGTDTLSDEFMPLIQTAFDAKASGDWTTFYQMTMEVAPEVQIPAMPGVEYGAESEMSMTTTPMMPGMPMPSKGLAPTARKSTPIRLVKYAQEEEEWAQVSRFMTGREPTKEEEKEYDYLDYYTQGVEPGSREETELLINLDPLQVQIPPEEAPIGVPEYMETVPLEETEEEREVGRVMEEEPEEEEKKEVEEGPKEGPKELVKEEPFPDIPAWWKGYWGIMTALSGSRYDEVRERLEANSAVREEKGEELFVDDLHDNLAEVGELYDVSSIKDAEQRAIVRSDAREKAFTNVWAPYALMHAFTIAGMAGMRTHQRFLYEWMASHFPPEFAEKFREISRLSSGADMEERYPDLLEDVYRWRDPAEGLGHGTDPTQWDPKFLAKIPETIEEPTGLKLGDDPKTAVDIGTITVDHPVYREYIRKPKRPEKPITHTRGLTRPDSAESVALEFPEEGEEVKGPGFATEKSQRWYFAQR